MKIHPTNLYINFLSINNRPFPVLPCRRVQRQAGPDRQDRQAGGGQGGPQQGAGRRQQPHRGREGDHRRHDQHAQEDRGIAGKENNKERLR